MARIVAFGEVMLRLSPPGRELLLQSGRFEAWSAGAEANVAIALARLGHPTAIVSALPDDAFGDGVLSMLRGHGVSTDLVCRAAGRMGLYFVTSGAGLRASEVIYDRAGSVFATMPADAWDWDRVLAGADRLHLSGITPALGPGPGAAALAAAAAATRLGVPVSFDGNYRARLWEAWDGQPRETLSALVAHADILFGDRRDVGLMLGNRFENDEDAVAAAFAHWPRLEVVARTTREAVDADCNRVSAALDARDGKARTDVLTIGGIVDRIGTGDAFAAGVLDALLGGGTLEEAADRGLALSALKHSLPGDASLFSRRDLDAFTPGGFDVRR